MRRPLFIAIFVIVISLVFSAQSFAAFYFDSISKTDLEHGKAYYWGLSHDLNPNEVITSACIEFKNINDWVIDPKDIIYIHLFQDAPYGKKWKVFNDNKNGDYFEGKGTYLFDYSDENEKEQKIKKWQWNWRKWRWEEIEVSVWVNSPEDYFYYFTPGQIDDLNKAMADGKFSFGFDSDCHYDLCGIKFCFETATTPEPATMSLLGLGLAGFVRRFKCKKV